MSGSRSANPDSGLKQSRLRVSDYLILGPLFALAAWAELVWTVDEWWNK